MCIILYEGNRWIKKIRNNRAAKTEKSKRNMAKTAGGIGGPVTGVEAYR